MLRETSNCEQSSRVDTPAPLHGNQLRNKKNRLDGKNKIGDAQWHQVIKVSSNSILQFESSYKEKLRRTNTQKIGWTA